MIICAYKLTIGGAIGIILGLAIFVTFTLWAILMAIKVSRADKGESDD